MTHPLTKWGAMKYIIHNILTGCLLCAFYIAHGQTIIFNCPTEDLTLCEPDDRIQLPDNNKVILGETDPDASSCTAHLRLQESVTSSCGIIVTFFVDYYPNNGTQRVRLQDSSEAFTNADDVAQLTLDTKLYGTPGILLNGIPYNEECPTDTSGFHRIVWTVLNECGDVDSCSYLFRLEDCFPPIAEAEDAQTIVFPVAQQVTITAQDFVAEAIDDCSPVNWLIYSWNQEFFQPVKTINCDSISENGSPAFEFNIWVADAGVDRNCDGNISWDERARRKVNALVFFEDDCAGEIFDGTILSENGIPVPGVVVSLHGGPQVLTTETDADGEYRLPEIDTNANYTIIPVKTTGVPDGISTLDLIKIQKHLLDIEQLSSPYKMIAADANNNSDISAADLLELRKVILRITSVLPNNTSWRFVPSTHVFSDTLNPWPFPSSSNLDDLDFIGIKVGDVNETITSAHAPPESYPVMVRNEQVRAGELVEIHVRSTARGRINGIQGTLNLNNAELVDILPGDLEMSLEDFAQHKTVSTFSWSRAFSREIFSGRVLFTILARVQADGVMSDIVHITSDVTEAEIYMDEDGDVAEYDLAFEFTDVISEMRLINHGANPIDHTSTVTIESPEDGEAKIWILDFSGRTMTTDKVDVINGQGLLHVPSVCKEVPLGAYVMAVELNGKFASMKFILGDY